MRVVAVNYVDDVDRQALLPVGWEPYVTSLDIVSTYKVLAQTAISEGWGHETVVVQDDVRFLEPLPTVHGESLVVYGEGKNHVCPRAFSAIRPGWVLLLSEWRDATDSLCPGFTRAVNELDAPVHNVTEHLWG